MVYRKVRIIEQSPLHIDDKIELLLVYAGTRPATVIHLQYHASHDRERRESVFYRDDHPEKISRIVKRIGLPHKLDERECLEIVDPYNGEITAVDIVSLYVARDQKTLGRMINAYKRLDDEEMGRCFGYPETAIQAYTGKRPVFEKDFHHPHHQGYFFQFLQSMDFFREELETGNMWYETVRRLSPKLLAEALEEPGIEELEQAA